MLCPKCGYENKNDAAACNLCGARLRRSDGSPATPGAPATPVAGYSGYPGQSGTPASPTTPSRPDDDIYPNPTAYNADPDAPPAADFLDRLDAEREAAGHKALYWLAGAVGILVVCTVLFVLSRLPYGAGAVDSMYADYVAEHPTSTFPESFHQYQTRREETKEYIFQFVHAYEQAFVEQNAYAAAEEKSDERLAAVQSGKADPGFSDVPTFTDTDEKTMDKIDDVQAIAGNMYGAGQKPFDTMRSLAGGDERGQEMRGLERELISGEKESQMQFIEADRANRINHYRRLEDKTREELKYFMENGSPKLRSIAEHLNDRLFGRPAE